MNNGIRPVYPKDDVRWWGITVFQDNMGKFGVEVYHEGKDIHETFSGVPSTLDVIKRMVKHNLNERHERHLTKNLNAVFSKFNATSRFMGY